MTKTSDDRDATSAQAQAQTDAGTDLTVVVTPIEAVQQRPFFDRVSRAAAKGASLAGHAANVAGKATASAAKATAETTGKSASATARSMTVAAKETAKAAKSASEVIERTAGGAFEASAGLVINVAASAAKTSARVGGKVATAASATFHFAGDLNGDGRCDVEDLRIAKAAIGKVAIELGGEALDLGKAALRHPIVKDAAAAALVGGVVAAAIPFVGIPLGAAVGAATVLAPGAAGRIIDKTVSGAARVTDQAISASKARRKTRAKSKP